MNSVNYSAGRIRFGFRSGGAGGWISRSGDVGAGVEEGFEFLRGFAAEAGDFGDLFEGGEAEALDAAEFFEERSFAALADAWEFVENAFGNPLETQLSIVGVGEAMGFVAHALEEF